MSFVPPFFETGSEVVIEPRGGQVADCTSPQEQLDLCFDFNECEGGCDLSLTSQMAKDCNVALQWTCVMTQNCGMCTSQITRMLECQNVISNCNFDECDDVPLPPILSGYYAPSPATTNEMAPAMSPSGVSESGETFMPTILNLTVGEVSSEDEPVGEPLFQSNESGSHLAVGGEYVGSIAVLVLATLWVMVWK